MKKTFFSIVAVLFTVAMSAFVPKPAAAQPKIDITVDFTGFSDGNTIIFVDDRGKQTTFSSVDGLIQTKKMKEGYYDVFWSINPSNTSSCQVIAGLGVDQLSLPEQPGSTTTSGLPIGSGVGGVEFFSFTVNCR